MAKIVQMLIVIAVGWAGIYWHWTDNGALLGMLGLMAAIAATYVWYFIIDRFPWSQ